MRQLADGNHPRVGASELVGPSVVCGPHFVGHFALEEHAGLPLGVCQRPPTNPPCLRPVPLNFQFRLQPLGMEVQDRHPFVRCRASLSGPAASKPPTGRIYRRREPSPDFACGLPTPWAGSARSGEARRSRFRSGWIPYSCSLLMLAVWFLAEGTPRLWCDFSGHQRMNEVSGIHVDDLRISLGFAQAAKRALPRRGWCAAVP